MKKNLLKVAAVALLAISTFSVNAQNATHRWGIGLHYSLFDYGNDFKTKNGEKYFNFDRMDQGAKISISRYLNRSLDLRLSGSIGEISGSNMVEGNSQTYLQYGADLTLRYKFNNGYLLKESFPVAPYIVGGLGLANMGFFPGGTQPVFNTGGGINFQLEKNVALQVQSVIHNSTDELFGRTEKPAFQDFFQHSIGLVFSFGKKATDEVIPTPEVQVPTVVDTDGDGIEDSKDKCPTVKGLAAFEGCPDTDGDGVEDSKDKCPTVQGVAAFEGCPDTDGDGIEDSKDKCPTVKGLITYEGCPDTDGDGVQDNKDECPNVPGILALNGCPDRDGDGVADIKDNCPDKPGAISNKGCPEIKSEEKAKLEAAVKSVQFETGKDLIKTISYNSLNDAAAILAKYEGYAVKINGHTDNTGDETKNQDLSERRAVAVSNYLQAKGVPTSRIIEVKGFGSSRPIADNKTVSGRAENRRTEILLLPR